MTLTEAKQYESQGWPHQHDWKPEPWSVVHEYVVLYGIFKFKCRCGAIKVKRGDFEQVLI